MEELIAYKEGELYGFKNQVGEVIVEPKYCTVWSHWTDGLCGVKDKNNLRGFIDGTGKEVIPCMYFFAHYANYGMILVFYKGGFGFVDKQNNFVIPPKYDLCTYFVNGYSKIELYGKNGRIDLLGNEEWFEDDYLLVTCALIIDPEKKRSLALKRSSDSNLPDKWELPGGKLEPCETAEECIVREIKKELELDIKLLKRLDYEETEVKGRKIRLLPYKCIIIGGNIKLNVHSDYCWLSRPDLFSVDWADGDRKILEKYFE